MDDKIIHATYSREQHNVADIRDLISRVNSIDVLVIIHKNPGINQMAATAGEGKNSKIKRLKEFVEAGLIIELDSSEGRMTKRYYLTSEGERFVKNWMAIENGEDVIETNHCAPEVEGNKVK